MANEDGAKMLTQNAVPETRIQKELASVTSRFDGQKIKESLVNFIIPLLSVIVMVILIFTIIKPAFNNVPALQMDLDSKTNLETVLKVKVSDLNKLTDFASVVEEDSDLVNKLLVSEPQVLELSTQISIIAGESGINLQRLTYSFGTDIESESGYSLVNVAMGGTANFNQLLSFLQNVENAARLIDVFNFRYSIDNDEVAGEVYGVSFVLVSPYLAVDSTAVTDEPLNLDITSQDFLDVLNKAKSLKYYDIKADDIIPDIAQEVEEVPDLTEEAPPIDEDVPPLTE